MRDDHAQDGPRNEAVRDSTTGDVVDSSIPSHGTSADEPSKDADDENGEDVVEEAAEDTVIY